MTPRDDAESGRIMLLTLGFMVLGLMLVAMVASATAVHLDHKRLYNLADMLAVDAADAATPEAYVDGHLALTDDDVEHAVRDALATYPFPEQLPDALRVVTADTPDARTARVTLTARSHPVLLAWFTRPTESGLGLTATSTARAFVAAG
jgi:hypothetical protein